MKNVLLIAFLTTIGTVAWAQRETLRDWVARVVEADVSPTMKEEIQHTSTYNSSNQVGSVQNDTKPTVELSAMLQAFDRILGLNEEQKAKVVHANEKAFEHINQTRLRIDIDDFAKKNEVNNIMKFRDERILRVVRPEQLGRWERFVQGKEALNSLKKTNERKIPYENGKKIFYPESEYGEFTSLEQIKAIIADQEAIIATSGFSSYELEQLHNTIYNFIQY